MLCVVYTVERTLQCSGVKQHYADSAAADACYTEVVMNT